jgi:hypothetical protein
MQIADKKCEFPLLLSTRRIRQNRTRLQKMYKNKLKKFISRIISLSLIFALSGEFALSASKQELSSPPLLRQETLSFKQMGAYSPLKLRGVDGSQSLPFSVRLDETITRARLKLGFNYSPALLQELSHLKVLVNEEVIAVFPLPKDKASSGEIREVDIDPRLITDFNRIRLQLIGHYTLECEAPLHSSLWASVSNQSQLELTTRMITLPTDLALLPAPFFDRRDSRRLELPFVFGARPSMETLRASGVIASWLGAQASYRGARFSANFDRLPVQHAIVVATNDELPQSLHLEKVQGPTLAVVSNIDNPAIKYLLVLGRDSDDLKLAADALVLGQATLSGQTATINSIKYEERRAAYDAPNWISTSRAVRFAELVSNQNELQVSGHLPDTIKVSARLAPDLFTWPTRGVPINLRYRYTPPAAIDESTLSVSINNQFIQAFRLFGSQQTGEKNRISLPLIHDTMATSTEEVRIPAFQVGSDNQLQFQFAFGYAKDGKCRADALDLTRAAIDPDSTIDLTGFPHYTAMPNLAYFANSGYPFTKYADLAETVVIMPDTPVAQDVEVFLSTLGHLGRSTGLPGMRFKINKASEINESGDADLLVIGSGSANKLLSGWSQALPNIIDGSKRLFKPMIQNDLGLANWFGVDKPDLKLFVGEGNLNADGTLAAWLGFQSPLKSGRSVIALTASNHDALLSGVDALQDGEKISKIQGDVAFIRNNSIESFRTSEPYYVGSLPWWMVIWYHLSRYPILLSIMGLIAGLILAAWLFSTLQSIAAKRLGK